MKHKGLLTFYKFSVMESMITAVIFDMDGVIADSEYFNVKAKHLI